METVLVLGANGFLGSHVVDELVNQNYKVIAFDIFRADLATQFNLNPNIEIFNGNFMNQGDLESALDNVDYVIHLVSTTTPATADADPLIDIETNVMGSIKLFQQCAKRKNIKKIIYGSSGGTVYGDRYEIKPMSEGDYTWPVSPYGIGKLTIENYLHYFDKKYGKKYVAFRISNPYGERQSPNKRQGVISIFLDKILKGESIQIFGDGEMVRDYIYVKDVARIIVLALSQELNHSVYNLGSGKGESINEVIETLKYLTGKEVKIEYCESPTTYVNYSVLDISRLNEDFHEVELTPFLTGMKNFYMSLNEINKL